MRFPVACLLPLLAAMPAFAADDTPVEPSKAAYVHAVVRGAGFLPWQERGVSEAERAFRAEIEARKDQLLQHSASVPHPVLYSEEDLERARAHAANGGWPKDWADVHIRRGDYVLAQPAGWVEDMIPERTPTHSYGFTCPHCVGEKSQEAVGSSLVDWSHENPDQLRCRACGQTYPDPKYPETATLALPRSGQELTYYLNDAERANPDDRSGSLAWHWVGHPIHVSFTGIIRGRKAGFMRATARSLGFAYAFTGDARYAAAARDVLVRFAHCYRNWRYHDYWDGYADCDPMYAAWHDQSLPLEWKRHLAESAFAKDTLETAGMMQSYWGAGRLHPSTDSISGLGMLVLAYDLTCTATTADGQPVWSPEERRQVERDLLLEYIMGAEHYVGGANQADCANNKAPRIYSAMASVAKCLGIPQMADTALRGFELVRDQSFRYDGFSKESPSYNNMYLSQLLVIPETLHGFAWPADFNARTGQVDYYANDPKLERMYRAVLWTLLPSGQYLPLSDTHVHSKPSDHIAHMGLCRFPGHFAGTMPRLGADRLGEYALFHLTEAELTEDTGLSLPETCFPAWRTAILRHGKAAVALPFNRVGGHRHRDNLALFYDVAGKTLLGEQGYVGDMPQNSWLRSTLSHNLVVVDGAEQEFRERQPQFAMMAVTPMASVVEASSNAYEQCPEYRRRVVLVKGPDGQSFVLDLFRVAGGKHHAFRVYSELAASDAEGNRLEFEGIDMPEEPPLPEVGASLARKDIFGLRDVREAAPEDTPWRAVWRDARGAYRLWMLSPCDRVQASNGPGQRSRKEAGRRVRYVDAVREGDSLASTFVALHEPVGPGGPVVLDAQRLPVKAGGERAVAVRVSTKWGDYVFLHDFVQSPGFADIDFTGDFAALHLRGHSLEAYMAVGATHLRFGEEGFKDALPRVLGETAACAGRTLTAAETPADGWPVIDDGAQAYARIRTSAGHVGYPVAEMSGNTVRVADYPLADAAAFEIPSVRFFQR